MARSVAANLNKLKGVIRTALVDRVVEDFMDAGTPLKHFTECVTNPNPDEKTRDATFEEKAGNLSKFAEKAVKTARMVAMGTSSGNKKAAEALMTASSQVT